ncbi:MAG: SUMF1/EgtB/PvdO family nonheme iron enzyme [Thiobacillus sp.]
MGKVTPIGAYPESKQGFDDLFGNVAEWCLSDCREPTKEECRRLSFPVIGCAWNKPPTDIDEDWSY